MASFTDSTPSFSPYVQQVPIEAMTQVGMTLQNRYDQGIQRIQNQIDSVAGLEIYKDVDKQYLQSKLNELGGDLKKVAAGDFSQYQLVNSVGGMINKIGRDNKILDAVRSTQVVKKGFADMEAARKAGKSSPENEWWWNNQVFSWASDPNVGSSFSGRYIEYHDIDKKLRDLTEQLKEIDNSIDVPFKRDNQGNILTDENGLPIADDAMVRLKTKSKSAERILSNFYTSLDERDKQQLMISANYHYRNLTKEGIKSELISNYNQEVEVLSESLQDINLRLKTDPKLTSAQRAQLEAKLNNTNRRLQSGELRNELQDNLANIDNLTDLTDYKYRIYTQKYLTNLAKDLSYESRQQEILSNPYAQASLAKARLQFQYYNARRLQNNWQKEYDLKLADLQIKQDQSSKPAVPGRLETDKESYTLDKLNEDIIAITGDAESGKVGMIDVLNSKYAPLLTNDTLETPEEKYAYLDNLVKKYAEQPSSIQELNPLEREYLNERRQLDSEADRLTKLYNATVEESKVFDEKLEEMFEGVKGYESDKYSYSAKELYDVRSDLTANFTKIEPALNPAVPPKIKVDLQGFLNRYRGTRLYPAALALAKSEGGKTAVYTVPDFLNLSPVTLEEAVGENSLEDKKLVKRINEISKDAIPKAREVAKERFKFQSDYVNKHIPERQFKIFTLDVNNSKSEDRVDEKAVTAFLGAKLLEYEEFGNLDNAKASDFHPVEIAKAQADKDAIFTVKRKFDGTGTLNILSKGKNQVVPISASESATFFSKYFRQNPIDKIKNIIVSDPGKTTNTNRKGDPVHAYITGYQLPALKGTGLEHLVRVDVEGNPNNDGSDNDRFLVRLYVNNGELWVDSIINRDYINAATLQETLVNQIGSKMVKDLLKKKGQ